MSTSAPRKHSFLSRLAIKAIHRAALALHAHTHRRAEKANAECMAILATTTDPEVRNQAVADHEYTMTRLQHIHEQSVSLLDQTEALLAK